MGAGDALARTPLHYAILFDNAEAAKLLLRRGASRCVARTLLCMGAMLTPYAFTSAVWIASMRLPVFRQRIAHVVAHPAYAML